MSRRRKSARREILLGGTCLVATTVDASSVLAAPGPASVLLDALGSSAPVDGGRVNLSLPEIAEDGSIVPLTVRVDSPMTEADHVRTITIVAGANPEPTVVVFHLTPASGRAEVSTRIRLAQTQPVVATAEMSDGSLFVGRAMVKVAIGGCG